MRRSLYQLRLNWRDGNTTFSRVYVTLKDARQAIASFADVSMIYSVELEVL